MKLTIELDGSKVANFLNALDEAHLVVSIAKSYTVSERSSTRYAKALDALTELFDLIDNAEPTAEPKPEDLEEKAFALMRAWGRTLAADEVNEENAEYGKDLVSACGAAAALIDVLDMDNEDLMEAMDEGKAKERTRLRADEGRES